MKKPTSEVFLPSAEQGFGVTEFISGNSRHTLPPSGEGKFVGVPTLLHWLKTALENRFDGSPFNGFLLGSKGRGVILAYTTIQQRHKRPYRSHKYAVNPAGIIHSLEEGCAEAYERRYAYSNADAIGRVDI